MSEPEPAPGGASPLDATAEEVAAVTAAVTLLWPGARVDGVSPAPSRWRFSGRDWTKPVPVSRTRPWRG